MVNLIKIYLCNSVQNGSKTFSMSEDEICVFIDVKTPTVRPVVICF